MATDTREWVWCSECQEAHPASDCVEWPDVYDE